MNLHVEEHEIVVQSLTEALLELMKSKPFSEISVTELIQKAGVARSTYYRNFNSKEDIIKQFIKSIFLEFQEKYPVISLEERYTEEHISHILEFLLYYVDTVEILSNSGMASFFLSLLNDYLMGLYEKESTNPKDSFRIYSIAGAEYNLIFNWFLKERYGNEELIQKYLIERSKD